MDYEFLRDVTGRIIVRMSMGHEAVGHWFNEEVKGQLSVLDDVEEAARALVGSERQWQHVGHEYTLSLDEDAVMVQANSLSFITDELEDGMSYYDEESLSFCGLDDFLALIAKYREFVQHGAI
ncbi:protein YacL [Pectobacterium cacticida]|uniref:UPF0231 protein QNA12_05560 n=1 Tax=Pectobacterium cacticida TaxID=69221 RepID=A0ABZ2GEU8_9GAMM|nr:protein YacL [Pectobacterium cacticida]UYX06174.1 protein YacL [Pectobacterium cacticida]